LGGRSRLLDGDGNLSVGPRLFTTASVRNILHNPFYAGLLRHDGQLLPGAHEAMVGKDLFDLVESALRKNSGRSATLAANPEREYLLKGIIRCAWCKMPMWSQTYVGGHRLYREHRESRSIAACPAAGGSISCHIADEQVGKLVEAIELGPRWLEEVLAIVTVQDEVQRVREQRKQVQEKLRRLGVTYRDLLIPEVEYQAKKRQYEAELESLIVPAVNAAEEAGRLIQDLPRLWAKANMTERRRLLVTMLDAVYVDAREDRAVVAFKPKPPFRPIFQVATTKEGSGIVLVKNEPDSGNGARLSTRGPTPVGPQAAAPEAPTELCSWWRWGRVELPVQKSPRETSTSVAGVCVLPGRCSSGVAWSGQPMAFWASGIGVGTS